jgi:hypothetical protein
MGLCEGFVRDYKFRMLHCILGAIIVVMGLVSLRFCHLVMKIPWTRRKRPPWLDVAFYFEWLQVREFPLCLCELHVALIFFSLCTDRHGVHPDEVRGHCGVNEAVLLLTSVKERRRPEKAQRCTSVKQRCASLAQGNSLLTAAELAVQAKNGKNYERRYCFLMCFLSHLLSCSRG